MLPTPPAAILLRGALIPEQTATTRGRRAYRTADVLLEDGLIKAIGSELPQQGLIIDCRDKMLLPGFVNAHTHSSEMWVRGLVEPLPLEIWLADIIELGEGQVDDEAYYLAALHVAAETLQSGGTCVLDHLSVNPTRLLPSLAAAVRAYRQAGIRAVICPLVSDLPLEQSVASEVYTPVPGRVEEIVAFMEEAVRQFHRPAEGISIGIGPTGVQRCSDQLFTALVALARAHGLPRHSHVLETRQQRQLAEGKYGCSAVEHMRQLGFLEGPGCSLAHAIHWSPADMALAAAAGCSIVHNPLSNLRLGSGRCPLEGFQAAGVNVALGCDGAASNDGQDMLEVVKMTALVHNPAQPEYRSWPDPYAVLRLASAGGAKAVGMEGRLGAVEVGQAADLTLWDLNALSMLPRTDPAVALVYGRGQGALHSAFVAGRPVVEHGRLRGIDVGQLRAALIAKQPLHAINDRYPAPRLRQCLEARYRRVMGLPP